MNQKYCLPYQSTKDVAAIKPSHYSCLMVTSEGTQAGDKECLPSSSQLLHPPTTVHPEGAQDEKTQDAGPRELRCIAKE